MERVSWDGLWMTVATAVSMRSLCVKRQVGAVVTDASHRVLGTGYNGPPAGLKINEPCDFWCPQGAGQADACLSLHAEINALLYTDRRLREGGTIYVSTAPCLKCSLAIANSGIGRLVCPPPDEHHDDAEVRLSRNLFINADVLVDIWNNKGGL